MYELSDARIRDIIETDRILSGNCGVRTTTATTGVVLLPDTKQQPNTTTAQFAMVKRISSSYQHDQLHTSIYSKYGDDDDDNTAVIKCPDAGDDSGTKQQNALLLSSVGLGGGGNGGRTEFFPSTKSIHSNNQLFWCFYIAHAGMFAYNTMTNAFITENAFKYATIDHLRANASRVKSNFKRYKLSVPNFEAELVGTKFLSLQMLAGLALCYERNVLYIDNRKYFEIIATDETDPFAVIEKVKNRYCVHCSRNNGNGDSVGVKMREMCQMSYWKMESITSPLKSVSHYKLAELQDIYARLDIKQTAVSADHARKHLTKPELYAAIVQNI